LINIITKNPKNAPVCRLPMAEVNVDIGFKANIGNAAAVLTGINYFNYSNPIDNKQQELYRLNTAGQDFGFPKWSFNRKDNKLLSSQAL
jgi:outer membrane receptor for ferrienterochelin and colicins